MQRKQSIAPWAGLSRKKLGKQQSHTERLRKEDAERRLPLRYAQTMESPPGLEQEGRMGWGLLAISRKRLEPGGHVSEERRIYLKGYLEAGLVGLGDQLEVWGEIHSAF